jgi:ring-1,2-phenylacetyl-CoA epoxidase subunit PaaE
MHLVPGALRSFQVYLADMLKFHALRVCELQPDAEDAVAVALDVPKELQPEYVGFPGQHIVLRAELEGEETRRTYSLINAPGEWPLRIVARVHENGRMSRHLAEQVKVGDRIDVLAPNGSLTPRLASSDAATVRPRQTYVGFASGCGITPIVSVAKAVLKSSSARQFLLFYGNSSTGRTMCLETLLGLKDRYLDRLALHFLMSREPQEVELYNGRIDGMRVRELARTLFKTDDVAEFFVCGPGDMIEQVTGALRALNVSANRIHAEHFTVGVEHGLVASMPSSTSPTVSAAEAVPALSADMSEVTVLMDGRRRTFAMRIGEDTILDAAARAGLDLPFSCRAGVCSTCRTKVVSGEVTMDQNYALEDWELEEGYVLACQSRVKSTSLHLDYDEK